MVGRKYSQLAPLSQAFFSLSVLSPSLSSKAGEVVYSLAENTMNISTLTHAAHYLTQGTPLHHRNTPNAFDRKQEGRKEGGGGTDLPLNPHAPPPPTPYPDWAARASPSVCVGGGILAC